MTFSVQALIGKGVFVLWQDLFGGTFETVNGYLSSARISRRAPARRGPIRHLANTSDRQRLE